MKLIRRLLTIAIIGAVLFSGVRFAEENAGPVTIDYLFGVLPETRLWAALLSAFGAGAVLAGLICTFQMVRLGLLSRRYRKLSTRLESEVHQLRNLPLSEESGAQATSGSPAGRSL